MGANTDGVHYCDMMALYLKEGDVAIGYFPRFREYGVSVLDGGTSFITLKYRPWCAAKLPSSLRDRWFREIRRLGLDPEFDAIPTEYQDDSWWRAKKKGT